MASIETRVAKSTGRKSFRVVWYSNGRKDTELFHDEDAALKWKKLIEAAGNNRQKAERLVMQQESSKPTLSEVTELHIERYIRAASDTKEKYRRNFKKHLEEPLGSVPIDVIDEDDIDDWIDEMIGKGLKAKTIKNIHGVLYSTFKTSMLRKYRYRSDNPCESSRLPDSDHIEESIMFLTQHEFRILLDQIPIHYQPFVLFLVGTGLRFGEATALQSADFTDHNGKYSVSVQKAWKTRADGTRYIGVPKSQRARRSVGLHKDLAETVAPLVAIAKPGEPVFKMARDGQMTSQAFYNRVWRDAVERAQKNGLRKKPRVHDLRHTFASWMLAEGMTMSVLSFLMGHESERTTRNVYSHMMPTLVQSSADAAGEAMREIFGKTNLSELAT